jgi:D-glycero-alpha-D-manno-heptose-7-phosphate kinase
LNALHAYRGERVSAAQLAEEASHVEIDMLKRPVGKQDHYAAAIGGLNYFCFLAGGTVTVEHPRLPEGMVPQLFNHLLMLWTKIPRDTGEVLSELHRSMAQKFELLRAMREHARTLQRLISNGFDPMAFGRVLDETWQLKRQLASTISNDQIDAWYHAAKAAGSLGGKICGAGGGGFLLLVVPPERKDAARRALSDLVEMPIQYESQGSRVLFVE